MPLSAAEYLLGKSENSPLSDNPLRAGIVYDGSDADRVDDFLRKVPENSTIRFSSGVFETRGLWDIYLVGQMTGFRVKSGWNVAGQGTNSAGGTVIRLVDVPVDDTGTYNANTVFSTGAIALYLPTQPKERRPNVDHVTIRDLQIDCNYQNLAKIKGTPELQLAGIQLLGNRGIKIVNVLVRNAASKRVVSSGHQLECFQVYVYNPWATNYPGDYLIDRVAIFEYQGGYTSAICINGNATGAIQNCTIDLASDNTQRYGVNFAAGLNRFIIQNNLIRNATRGINNDTGPICTDVLIVSNRLMRCGTGMFLANSQSNRVIANTISLEGTGCGIALQYHPTMEHVKSRACVLAGNIISGEAGEGISLGYINDFDATDMGLYWSEDNTLQGNIISERLHSKIPPAAVARNTLRPGNRRHFVDYPACDSVATQSNLAAIGFPSDIGPGAACNYCELRATGPQRGYISRVKLSGTKLDLRSDSGDRTGYSELTTGYAKGGLASKPARRNYEVQWADVRRGRSYRLGVYTSDLEARDRTTFQVFVDWNHDGRFDSVDELAAFASGKERLGAPLRIPSAAPLGSTVMRVIMAVGPPPDPCASHAFVGDVEDFTISVVP